MRCAVLSIALGILVGCSGGAPEGGGGGGATLQQAPLVVASGMTQIEPAPSDFVSPGVDLERLDVEEVGVVYELTTPADLSFTFDVFSRNEGNEGAVRVSVAHAADNGTTPQGGLESLAVAGIVPSATGAGSSGAWYDATGDGFARITVSGSIEREQVIAIEAANEAGKTTALICLRIGPESEINVESAGTGDYPGVEDERVIYSSDSFLFGMPTVAVSGDRTSIVCYEGDQSDPFGYQRYELRLQLDTQTGEVTGGADVEPSPDTGNWRDHEIAALYNVLALVRGGTQEVKLRISFDRGATFPQTETIALPSMFLNARLVQIAMADDYTLGVVFWQEGELVFVEGRPSAFDGGGSPTQFAFDPPQIVARYGEEIMPVIMGMDYSEGGDLVIGYGLTSFSWNPETRESRSTTEFHALVRMFGETGFTDALVEEDVIISKDPSVSLVGSGDDLRIFYAYEGRDGVRLRTSDDGGATWSDPVGTGDRMSYLPQVIARGQDDGTVKVDLLYLTFGVVGTELHLRHWEDFDNGPGESFTLVRSRVTENDEPYVPPTEPPPPGTPPRVPFDEGDEPPPPATPPEGPRVPFDEGEEPDLGAPFAPPHEYMFLHTQVGWFGYDATRDGDEVVVCVHEQTSSPFDVIFFGGDVRFEDAAGGIALPAADGSFTPAEPPPLAAGLTEPVPPPDPDDMNQLRVIRLR